MHRPILMMVVILATLVWTLTALVVRDARAATTPTRGNVSATAPSEA
jgi:hypothetical protein